jgi:hypothetical protein
MFRVGDVICARYSINTNTTLSSPMTMESPTTASRQLSKNNKVRQTSTELLSQLNSIGISSIIPYLGIVIGDDMISQ